MFRGPVKGSAVVEAWADEYIRFEGRPAWQEQLRTEIRSHCRELNRSDGDILHARFFGAKPQRADVENLVLYNIDSFSVAGAEGIRLEYGGPVVPQVSGGEYRFCYRYSRAPRSDDFVHWQQVRPLASFGWTDLKGKTLGDIWLALARRRLFREVSAAEQPLDPGSPFALRVQLRPPHGRARVNADLMKAIFDGVICAFQTHADKADPAEIVARLAKFLQVTPEEIERLLSDQEGAVIGSVPRLVYLRGAGVQWNPSDDRCLAGELIPAEPVSDGTCWAIKGELVEISFSATDS